MDAGDDADRLVCGSCQRNFPLGNIVNFVQHKKFDCYDQELVGADTSETLACQSCPLQFGTPWSLLKHAQNVHALKIYMERGSFGRGVVQRECENKASNAIQNVIACSNRDYCKEGLAAEMQRVPDHGSFVSPSIVQICDTAEADVKNLDAVSSDNDTCTADAARNDFTAVRTDFKDGKLVIDMENIDPSQQPADADETGRSTAILDKCCTAVVPKKRKRHMEMKHGGGGGSSLRKRSHSIQGTPTSIYIDLEPGAEGEVFKASLSHGDDEQSKTSEWMSSSVSGGIRRHSVIIPPGTTFSIPVSYASATTLSAASKSFLYVQAMRQQEVTSSCSVAQDSVTLPAAGLSVQDVGGQQNGKSAVLQKQSATVVVAATGGDYESFNDGRGDEQDHDGSQSHQQKRRRYPTSRPFKCDQCNDSFNQRVHLKKHQSKHTGVKPFKCDQCDYSTVERSHLKVHIRVHTGEKPYKCTYCKYATAQNSTLKIHLKRHHLDSATSHTTPNISPAAQSSSSRCASLTCNQCGSCFEEEEAFTSHAVNEHSSATPPNASFKVDATTPSDGSCVRNDSPTKQTGANSCGGGVERHCYATTSKHGGVRLTLSADSATANQEIVEKHTTASDDKNDDQ